MEFFDPKEEVIDLQLTPYGKYMLSMGRFKPHQYAFYEDAIIYDSRIAMSGVDDRAKELQNEIEPRIQEDTPRLKAQTLFRGAEIGVFSTAPNMIGNLMPGVLADKKDADTIKDNPTNFYILQEPLGQSAYNSDKAPAWSVAFLNTNLKSAETLLTGSRDEIPTTFIPQLECEIKYEINKFKSTPETQAAAQSINVEDFDAEIYDGDVIFPDGTRVEYKEDFMLLQIEEANTEFIRDNFDIEVFEIVDVTGSSGLGKKVGEVLKKMTFTMNDNDQPAVGNVEYFFDIELDHQIDNQLYCSLVTNNKVENIYSDKTFVCPEQDPGSGKSLDVYNSGDSLDIEEIC